MLHPVGWDWTGLNTQDGGVTGNFPEENPDSGPSNCAQWKITALEMIPRVRTMVENYNKVNEQAGIPRPRWCDRAQR